MYTIIYRAFESEGDVKIEREADSLAALTNWIRSNIKAYRIRVWSSAGLQLIDTKFGDNYRLASNPDSLR